MRNVARSHSDSQRYYYYYYYYFVFFNIFNFVSFFKKSDDKKSKKSHKHNKKDKKSSKKHKKPVGPQVNGRCHVYLIVFLTPLSCQQPVNKELSYRERRALKLAQKEAENGDNDTNEATTNSDDAVDDSNVARKLSSSSMDVSVCCCAFG